VKEHYTATSKYIYRVSRFRGTIDFPVDCTRYQRLIWKCTFWTPCALQISGIFYNGHRTFTD